MKRGAKEQNRNGGSCAIYVGVSASASVLNDRHSTVGSEYTTPTSERRRRSISSHEFSYKNVLKVASASHDAVPGPMVSLRYCDSTALLAAASAHATISLRGEVGYLHFGCDIYLNMIVMMLRVPSLIPALWL